MHGQSRAGVRRILHRLRFTRDCVLRTSQFFRYADTECRGVIQTRKRFIGHGYVQESTQRLPSLAHIKYKELLGRQRSLNTRDMLLE